MIITNTISSLRTVFRQNLLRKRSLPLLFKRFVAGSDLDLEVDEKEER